jgi:hypothetical protein
VVSTNRSKAIREKKKVGRSIGGKEKKKEFEGEIYQEQKTSEPYTHLS